MNRYSVWQYILLAGLIIFGVLYAAPVFYGDSPAIQVSAQDGHPLQAAIKQKIATALKKQQLPYESIQRQKNSYLIRFDDTRVQLKAQGVLEASLGSQYAVALNLSPNTPSWLQALGARPMKLGLDLRGGVHFLLQVDVDAMLKGRVKNDIHAISSELRKNRIRYSSIKALPSTSAGLPQAGMRIGFRTEKACDAAIDQLKPDFTDYQYTKEQKNGQYVLLAKMTQQTIVKLSQYAVDQNMVILRNRVNDLGVAEPVIRQQGKDQISVDLPGIQNMARAQEMIGKVAVVRFQLVDTDHDAEQVLSSGVVPFGSSLYRNEDGRPVLLKNQIVLQGRSVTNASATLDQNGRPAVSVQVSGSEVNKFSRITTDNIGKPLAVLYIETKPVTRVVNGKVKTHFVQEAKVISVATIQSTLGHRFQITGLQSMQYSKNLALQLRSGAYLAPVKFVQKSLVGPSMGQANIDRGVVSVIVGSLLVIVFMAIYYRLFGLIADAALILNVVILVALMALLGFTLTLPGIAAIVLTVGMAVDANVLINERIREELRNGVTPQAAIYAGYERAFTTIVDANVTTLIVAVVLFALGNGPVRGFAVALTIGLLISMVTAIFFTRALVNLVYGGRQVSQLSIGIRVKKALGGS